MNENKMSTIAVYFIPLWSIQIVVSLFYKCKCSLSLVNIISWKKSCAIAPRRYIFSR